ncbi:multicopper oxidase domain-containing protein [Cyanobium sp. FGCU-52]|nr:multicopper oxidase domain-containing protein [Cyanobium sp. FGCU52]
MLFKAWSLNGRIPGPTFRARQGERLRLIFDNGGSTSHSLHVHGVHPAAMDGIEPVPRGQTVTYEFDLPSAGLFPYHCRRGLRQAPGQGAAGAWSPVLSRSWPRSAAPSRSFSAWEPRRE